jgi:hypothetical protein
LPRHRGTNPDSGAITRIGAADMLFTKREDVALRPRDRLEPVCHEVHDRAADR